MPDPVSGVIAAASLGSAVIGSKASSKAAKAQTVAADMGVAEQRAAREEMRRLLQPYVAAGTPALRAQMDLAGLGSDKSQQDAVAELSGSPLFQSLARQGEEGILANASATGGLRGGNTQGALAQFRPALLNQFIEQQYARLGGLATMGQNSAAGVGSAGMIGATNIADLLGQAGAAQAGGALGQGAAFGGALNNAAQLGGLYAGGAFGGRGGTGSPYASLAPDVYQNIAMNPSIF